MSDTIKVPVFTRQGKGRPSNVERQVTAQEKRPVGRPPDQRQRAIRELILNSDLPEQALQAVAEIAFRKVKRRIKDEDTGETQHVQEWAYDPKDRMAALKEILARAMPVASFENHEKNSQKAIEITIKNAEGETEATVTVGSTDNEPDTIDEEP